MTKRAPVNTVTIGGELHPLGKLEELDGDYEHGVLLTFENAKIFLSESEEQGADPVVAVLRILEAGS